MKFLEPVSVGEAVKMLADDPDARCIAGGQSLVPVLNMGFADFETLVALRSIPELATIRTEGDTLVIGAMTTHATLEASPELSGGWRALREAASKVANPAVRSQGTIGGSICHADPAADYPSVLVALDAEIEAQSASGRRLIPAAEFFQGFLTTALEPTEIVTTIRLPATLNGAPASGVYEKIARAEGDFATVSATCVLSVESGVCSNVALALGACDMRPVRSADAEAELTGGRLDHDAIDRAGRLLCDAADPPSDIKGSSAYRRRLIPVIVARVVRRAQRALET